VSRAGADYVGYIESLGVMELRVEGRDWLETAPVSIEAGRPRPCLDCVLDFCAKRLLITAKTARKLMQKAVQNLLPFKYT
jgi:hypothetical protein